MISLLASPVAWQPAGGFKRMDQHVWSANVPRCLGKRDNSVWWGYHRRRGWLRWGPGARSGKVDSVAYTGGGGGYGGYGGMGGASATSQSATAYGGVPYGSTPTGWGSGGACYSSRGTGGAGGGSIELTVKGALLLDGRISADGSPGLAEGSGGGSGGSISMSVGTLLGGGTISANGGMGSGFGSTGGGGGGGGRIGIHVGGVQYSGYLFSGAITALGGGGSAGEGPERSTRGHVYLQPGAGRQWRPCWRQHDHARREQF